MYSTTLLTLFFIFWNSDSDSSSDSESSRRRKKSKHKHKLKKSKHKKASDSSSKHKSKKSSKYKESDSEDDRAVGPAVSKSSDKKSASSGTKGPMTKEMWEKQQSVVRRVYDPDTGRTR